MRWRSPTAVVVIGAVLCGSCGVGSEAEDPSQQPEVTVLGTSVADDQPQPTLGTPVSTER
ncbi:MAG: hypothetical protein HKN24_01630 [Acidimicrobiales bacterium]|nr:hypothetical protein [Acidimicrobiales bacterium]